MPQRFVTGVLGALMLIFISPTVLAQETAVEREINTNTEVFDDFVVGPAKTDIVVAPGENKSFYLTVTNRLGVAKEFTVSFEDIAGSNDPAKGVTLLGADTGPYSLRDFVSLPVEKIVLEHGEQARIPVRISLPESAGPNGRYGSVVVSIVSEKAADADVAPRSAVVSRIGSLVLVSTPGEKELSSSLEHFGTVGDKVWFARGPIELAVLYKNSGNTHVTPYGEIRIYNMLNQEVGAADIEPWYVLPQSSRLREITWNKSPLLGRYTAVLTLYDGYTDVPVSATTVFYVVNWWSVGVVIGVALLAVFLFGRRKRTRGVNQ